jgi:hypothetical protein
MSELILDGDIVVKDCDRQLVDDILRRQRGTSTSRHSSPDACRHLIRRRAASQRHARHPPIESRPASDGRRTIVGSVSHLQGPWWERASKRWALLVSRLDDRRRTRRPSLDV